MPPDGGDVTRLSPATAASDPAWKPDRTKLVGANLVCGSSSGCSSRGLLVMTAAGTRSTTVSAGADYAPAPRPRGDAHESWVPPAARARRVGPPRPACTCAAQR